MDKYLERLKNGTLKLYALEKEVPAPEAIRIRRAFIEQEAGVQLPEDSAPSPWTRRTR